MDRISETRRGRQGVIMDKALPRKDRSEPAAKKTPVRGSSKKKVGAGGRTRYSYPAEKSAKPGGGAKKPAAGQQVAPVEPETLPVSVEKLSARLGFHPDTIHKIVGHFHQKKVPGGKDGFAGFMGAHLKEFNEKHKVEPSYWGRIYDASVHRPR